MSANNYTICPRCGRRARQRQEAVREQYGKVPWGEYQQMLAEAQRSVNTATLRENYEIGIWRGKFEVDYLATCENCGFEFAFSTRKDLLPAEDADTVSDLTPA